MIDRLHCVGSVCVGGECVCVVGWGGVMGGSVGGVGVCEVT